MALRTNWSQWHTPQGPANKLRSHGNACCRVCPLKSRQHYIGITVHSQLKLGYKEQAGGWYQQHQPHEDKSRRVMLWRRSSYCLHLGCGALMKERCSTSPSSSHCTDDIKGSLPLQKNGQDCTNSLSNTKPWCSMSNEACLEGEWDCQGSSVCMHVCVIVSALVHAWGSLRWTDEEVCNISYDLWNTRRWLNHNAELFHSVWVM